MKVGIALHLSHSAGLQVEDYVAIARRAEDLGYESLWLGDHMVLPSEITSRTFPYAVDRKPFPPQVMLQPDSLFVFAHLAAATQRIRFGTSVFILPLRNVFSVAHAVASLDMLSKGRFDFGVGIGWLKEEFDIVGEKFEDRGGRTAEMIQIMKGLWTQETFEFHGRHYSFGPVRFQPKPVQRPHIPVHLGGIHPAVIRCVVEHGDGWIAASKPTGPRSPEEVRDVVQRIRRLRREAGRDDKLEVTVGAPSTALDVLLRYGEAGADRVTLRPWGPSEGPFTTRHAITGMERFAEQVLSKIKD